MIKAVRNEMQIIVHLAGTNATVEADVPLELKESFKPYNRSLELGIKRHLHGEYHLDRHQAAISYMESEGWEILDDIPPDLDPSNKGEVY